MLSENRFIVLRPPCVLKLLEAPYLYDLERDELYELSPEAYGFLLRVCQGENPPLRPEDEAFIQFCLEEQLVAFSERPEPKKVFLSRAPVPSLRYLELLITDRCNLRCRHCYLGEGRHQDLEFDKILKILEEFEAIHGLRLLLSGGEPLLHPEFWRLNDVLGRFAFRSVLLSNGSLITEEVAEKLRVHEVQISLDGMKEGHEALRGEGRFEEALRAIDRLQASRIRISVATMIHRRNLNEFEQLKILIESKGIEEWNVDVPCVEGRLEKNNELWVTPEEAGPLLHYGFGGGLHASDQEGTCGTHLCAVLPDGSVCKCGLFSQEPVGTVSEGLRACWERIPRIRIKDLTCHCDEVNLCKGGCRYRAKTFGSVTGPDPFQCAARGFSERR